MEYQQSSKQKYGYKIQNHSSVQPLFFFNIGAFIIRSNRRPYRKGESVLKNMQKPEKPALDCHFGFILDVICRHLYSY
jgi:hypothetical protein